MAFSNFKKVAVGAARHLFSKGSVVTDGSSLADGNTKLAFMNSRNRGLLLDGKKGRLSLKESFQNVFYIAKPGIGKTTGAVIPPIMDLAVRNASMVINDPKGEVWEKCSGYLKANGYNIVVFNVSDIENSNLFNPLTEARNETELEQIAETLIWAGNPSDSEPYWNNGAKRILSVLMKCLAYGDEQYNNLANLYLLLQNFGKDGKKIEDWVLMNCMNPNDPDDHSVYNEWKGIFVGNDEGIASFVATCMTALSTLTNKDMRIFFSKTDYDLSRLRREKTAIFFITPAKEERYWSPVISVFFKSIFNEAMREEYLSGNALPLFMVYDEFGNSYIPNFPSIINLARGYDISILAILQSIKQFDIRYGRDEADVIKTGFGTYICMTGADSPTLQFFSEMAGVVRERQYKDWKTEPGYDYREYNLMNPDEIRRMGDYEILIISKNRNPIKTAIKPYFEHMAFDLAGTFEPYLERVQPHNNKVPMIEIADYMKE